MSADHGGGLDDQHHSVEASPVEGPGQQGENGSVGGSETRPVRLPSQDEDLVAQGEDLGVTLVAAHQEQPDTGDKQSKQVRQDR